MEANAELGYDTAAREGSPEVSDADLLSVRGREDLGCRTACWHCVGAPPPQVPKEQATAPLAQSGESGATEDSVFVARCRALEEKNRRLKE